MVVGGGYGGDFHDSGGDDGAFDSDDDEGAWSDSDDLGMATKPGLKAMLAKARGDSRTPKRWVLLTHLLRLEVVEEEEERV